MAVFELKFKVVDAASSRPEECARVLREIANTLDSGCVSDYARDAKGNKMGDWWIDINE